MKLLYALTSIVVILTVLGAGIFYLSTRFQQFFPISSGISWLWIFSILSVLMLIGMMAFMSSGSRTGQLLGGLSNIVAGLMLYLILSTIMIDLFSFIINIRPITQGFMSIGLMTLISLYGLWNASTLQTYRVEIPVRGLTEEIRAVHVSDIHLGHFRGERHLQQIVDHINQLDPQFILNTGDFFDAKSRLYPEVLAPLQELTVPHYFVEGNHDNHTGFSDVRKLLVDAGVRVMENEVIPMDPIQLVGLKHMLADRESIDFHATEGKTIQETLYELQIEPDKPAILLHHSPDGANYAEQFGIDVMLSGHTHGGQMFPFNYISNWLFTYNKGLFSFKEMTIYVTQGAGTFFTPMRVGTTSEITLITLKPA